MPVYLATWKDLEDGSLFESDIEAVDVLDAAAKAKEMPPPYILIAIQDKDYLGI